MESMKDASQKGFTLIELLIVISIIGILSVVAVPRFSNAIVLANTAKVQSDLRALNTAIAMYQAENGKYPTNLSSDLKGYIVDIDNLKPPSGKCLLRGQSDAKDFSGAAYGLTADGTEAKCGEYTIKDFGKQDKN